MNFLIRRLIICILCKFNYFPLLRFVEVQVYFHIWLKRQRNTMDMFIISNKDSKETCYNKVGKTKANRPIKVIPRLNKVTYNIYLSCFQGRGLEDDS